MPGTDLYRLCPRCNGSGIVRTPSGTAACIDCRPRWTVVAPVSLEVLEQIRDERDRYRDKLYELAGGCSQRQKDYGIPNARTCERCGLGPCYEEQQCLR